MKKKIRKLELKRETVRQLSELSPAQLDAIAGRGFKYSFFCDAGTTTYRCGGG